MQNKYSAKFRFRISIEFSIFKVDYFRFFKNHDCQSITAIDLSIDPTTQLCTKISIFKKEMHRYVQNDNLPVLF